MNNLVNKYETN